MSMEYLCFIHGWTVQVIGRDVFRMEEAEFYGLHRLVDPVDAILEYVDIVTLSGLVSCNPTYSYLLLALWPFME